MLNLQSILGDEKVLLGVIRDELLTIKVKYGDDRKTALSWQRMNLMQRT